MLHPNRGIRVAALPASTPPIFLVLVFPLFHRALSKLDNGRAKLCPNRGIPPGAAKRIPNGLQFFAAPY